MPGPAPKHPSTRARRNKSTTASTIKRPAKVKVPQLPDHDVEIDGEMVTWPWHAQTLAWWGDVWSSPMSSEWDDSDIHNVYICALLIEDMWRARTTNDRQKAAAEYRLQRKDLGLTPFDRRRLEWTIETADEAKDRGNQRRARKAPPAPTPAAGKANDPRGGLSIVS